MKSTVIVLACGAIALTATGLIEAINALGPFVFLCLYTALMTVSAIGSEASEVRTDTSLKKAA